MEQHPTSNPAHLLPLTDLAKDHISTAFTEMVAFETETSRPERERWAVMLFIAFCAVNGFAESSVEIPVSAPQKNDNKARWTLEKARSYANANDVSLFHAITFLNSKGIGVGY
jgi:hypothetical protein